MKLSHLPLYASLLALAAPSATAQQLKVVPMGMDFVESPLVYTYPFGRQTGAISLLYDADQITTQQGILFGIRFRQSKVTAAQLYPSYTKNYQVTAYTVQAMAATMAANPLVNAGSAVGTVVFNGPLTLPAVTQITTYPADFGIHIPFTTPYVYDGSTGNLLLVIETADTVAVPGGSYRLDAVNFANNVVTGLSANIDDSGCSVQGQSLTLAAAPLAAIVGGSITQTLTSSSLGAFPAVMAGISFTRFEQNLAMFGMPSCTSWMGPSVLMFALENPTGGYPNIVWSLPNDPSIEGIALCGQALGLPPSGLLSDSVTSNGVGTRIGSSSFPVKRMGMSFSNDLISWSQGTNGTFIAVAQFDGVFP
jgi:hypothetical protein